jgi:hypothetical protein
MHILKRILTLAAFAFTISSCATQQASSGLTRDEAIAVAVAELVRKASAGQPSCRRAI